MKTRISFFVLPVGLIALCLLGFYFTIPAAQDPKPQTTKLTHSRYDVAVGTATFQAGDFSLSENVCVNIPAYTNQQLAKGPYKDVDDSSCFATVRFYFTLIDRDRIQPFSESTILEEGDLNFANKTLHDTPHLGLVCEYPIYQDRSGFCWTWSSEADESDVAHRFTSMDKYKLAIEAIDFFQSKAFPLSAHDSRATLVNENMIEMPRVGN